MTHKAVRLFLIGATVAMAAVAVPAAGASADSSTTPVATGCPSGYVLFAAETFPYRVAAHLDDPAYGGNHDGFVCAHQLPDAVRDAFCARGLLGYCFLERLGLPVYLFIEDDNPATGATSSIPALGA